MSRKKNSAPAAEIKAEKQKKAADARDVPAEDLKEFQAEARPEAADQQEAAAKAKTQAEELTGEEQAEEAAPQKKPPARREAQKVPKDKEGPAGQPEAEAGQTGKGKKEKPPLVAGVGASAGGLEAFTDLLRHLPRDTGMAFVLIQHLPPKQNSMLAQILGKATVLPVAEATDRIQPQANHVYILPPGEVMEIRNGALRLVKRESTEGRYLPVDTFLTSLAADKGSRAIGVILSGTASDGVQGMKAIKEAGGITFAQDDKTAKYPGMPQSSVAAGCVDFILSPEGIARELGRIAHHPYIGPFLPQETMKPGEENAFAQILNLLKIRTGVDFNLYKHSTIRRRTFRRMALKKADSLKDYLAYLKEHPEEVNELYADILINVTSFFRDPEIFDELKQSVFPKLMQDRAPDQAIRIWVPGCSTGEEVYSLVMAFLEYFTETRQEAPLQVFGTDIDNSAIDIARAGKYGAHLTENLSGQRLGRFFAKVDSGYQINKSIRERCTFARQNLVKDPPFSHLDLISCRNVLIYLGPVLQKKIIPIFHFALKSGGYLILGKSEAVSAFQDMFTVVEKKYKFYQKRDLPGRVPLRFALESYAERENLSLRQLAPDEYLTPVDLAKEADRIILARFTPAGVVVDENLNILQFRGHTGQFLEPMAGEASLNLLRMVRESLRPEVGAAMHQAIKGGTPVRKEGLKVKYNGRDLDVNIEVFPVSPGSFQQHFYLLVFEDVTPLPGLQPEQPKPKSRKSKATFKDERLEELKHELAATKEFLQATIEEQETSLEELKSTNEEIMSSNEELQSVNEELEAAQEELQSANEELATVNEELENRNVELAQTNDDLANLLSSVNFPILFLDHELRIRRFNTVAKETLHLIPSDVGRPIGDIKTGLEIGDFEGLLRDTIDNLKNEIREVQDDQGKWYQLQIRPYKTSDSKIEGLVLSLADIDALKHSLREAEGARNYSQAIIETLREPLLVLDRDLRVISANQAFYELFKIPSDEAKNRLVYELGDRQLGIPELRRLLEEILLQNSVFQGFEVDSEFPHIGRRVLILNGRRLHQEPDPDLILLAMQDITSRKEMEESLKDSEGKLQVLNAELINAQEGERQSLSQSLHEELAQNLVALKLKLRDIAPHLTAEQMKDKENLDQAMRSIDGLVEEARELSWVLRPQVLDLGLRPALRHLAEQFSRYFEIDGDLQIPALDHLFVPQTQVMIYRVLHEALVNVVKHAQATEVSLAVEKLDGKVRFRVSDNGVGFQVDGAAGVEFCKKIQASPDQAYLVGGVPFMVKKEGREFEAAPEVLGPDTGRKMGLALMEGRIRYLGGTFQITSEKDQGTILTFAVPTDGAEAK